MWNSCSCSHLLLPTLLSLYPPALAHPPTHHSIKKQRPKEESTLDKLLHDPKAAALMDKVTPEESREPSMSKSRKGEVDAITNRLASITGTSKMSRAALEALVQLETQRQKNQPQNQSGKGEESGPLAWLCGCFGG